MSQDIIEGTAIAVRESYAPAEWTPSFAMSVDDKLAVLRERDRFYREVLKPDLHYGIIPGTNKPSLWKPGAEALLSSMGLRSETGNEDPPVIDVTGNDHNGEPFVMYVRWCRIYRQTGPTINDRIEIAKLSGACNSWEPKYRYRNSNLVCPECGKEAVLKSKKEEGWFCWKKKDGCGANFGPSDQRISKQEIGKVPNENVLELQNTILKMADKRALIAATLVATGCSDIFTQDVEDMPRTTGEPRNVTPTPANGKPPPKRADADSEADRERGRTAVRAFARDNHILDTHRWEISQSWFGQASTKPQPEDGGEPLSTPMLRRLYALLAAYVRNRDSIDGLVFEDWLAAEQAKAVATHASQGGA